MKTKKEIRKDANAARLALTKEEWQNFSNKITEKMISLPEFIEASHIFCFMDFKGEVCTDGIIQAALSMEKIVYIPRVEGEIMYFYRYESEDDLVISNFGIEEPAPGAVPADVFEGLMVVPGVSFDKNCNRLGFGGGYYDRFLSEHTRIFKAAVAFECQLCDRIPTAPHDINPDLLITERDVYYANT